MKLVQNILGACTVAVVGLPVSAQSGPLVVWGTDDPLLLNIPAGNFLTADAGAEFCVGIREDRTLAAWGHNYGGVLNVPSGTFTQVSGGEFYAVGIQTDRTLAGWGSTAWGLTNVPTGTFTKVDAEAHRCVGLRTDGTIESWGAVFPNQTPTGQFLDVAAGADFGLALRTDGTLVVWEGDPLSGILNVPSGQFVAVAAGQKTGVALRADGTVQIWGSISGNPALITGFVSEIKASSYDVFGRRSDGTLTSWSLQPLPPGPFSDLNTTFGISVGVIPAPSNVSLLFLGVAAVNRRSRAARDVSRWASQIWTDR